MVDLEHCPFCGTNYALMPDCSGRYQQIVCGACGARGPEVYRFLPYMTAVDSWNARQRPSDVNETHRPDGARMDAPAGPREIELNIIRFWPDGMAERLEHVWKDVIGFIPNYKLHDLQRALAEFGFTMKVYEQAPETALGTTTPNGEQHG